MKKIAFLLLVTCLFAGMSKAERIDEKMIEKRNSFIFMSNITYKATDIISALGEPDKYKITPYKSPHSGEIVGEHIKMSYKKLDIVFFKAIHASVKILGEKITYLEMREKFSNFTFIIQVGDTRDKFEKAFNVNTNNKHEYIMNYEGDSMAIIYFENNVITKLVFRNPVS